MDIQPLSWPEETPFFSLSISFCGPTASVTPVTAQMLFMKKHSASLPCLVALAMLLSCLPVLSMVATMREETTVDLRL